MMKPEMRRISVAAIGDVLDINTHSNLPYFLFTEGKRQGVFTDALRLDLSAFTWKRRFWNLKQLMLGRGVGGFQYSTNFLNALERQIPTSLLSTCIITFNQVFPRAGSLREGGELVHYIDATLRDLVDNPSYSVRLPSYILNKALEQEHKNYAAASHVVVFSSWIIPTLVEEYGVDRNKIAHIMPGANVALPPDWAPPTPTGRPGIERELILGFVGKDWQRKGLPFLMKVQAELAKRGYKVKIRFIGSRPPNLTSNSAIEITGFIDKQLEMERFVHLISSCDIGCLFSSSEAFGLSTIEFLRTGVPVAGFYHQGLRDTLLEGASFRFKPGDHPEEVADAFEQFIRNDDLRHEMKGRAWSYSNEVTWAACVARFKKLIAS